MLPVTTVEGSRKLAKTGGALAALGFSGILPSLAGTLVWGNIALAVMGLSISSLAVGASLLFFHMKRFGIKWISKEVGVFAFASWQVLLMMASLLFGAEILGHNLLLVFFVQICLLAYTLRPRI